MTFSVGNHSSDLFAYTPIQETFSGFVLILVADSEE